MNDEPASLGAPRRRRQRGRRRFGWVAVGIVILAGIGWITVTALLARSQLNSARTELTALKTALAQGNTSQANSLAISYTSKAEHAHTLTTGPAWWLAAQLPWVGAPMVTMRGITSQSALLGHDVVPGLLAVARTVTPQTLRAGGNSVNLAELRSAAPVVHQAATALTAATSTVDRLPHSTWLPPVNAAQHTVSSQLGDVAHTLRSADQALQILPTLLGATGTKRYFVGFENEAEMRGTGGLPGAFAILTATNGKIAFERFGADSVLGTTPVDINFGPDYTREYGPDGAYSEYVDTNESPHFPYAAQLWAAMWQKRSGEKVDGAIAIDPTAMGYLLDVTGGTVLPDGQPVTGANFAALTQKDVYAKFPDVNAQNTERKAYLLAIAQAASKKLLSGAGDTRQLVAAGAKAASEGRILVWSNDPTVEAVLAQNRVGGVIPDTAAPFSMVSINNGAGSKLDYYLNRSVTVVRSGCGATRNVDVTITLTNNAPTSGLPPYVTTRADNPKFPTVPGQNRLLVDYIATKGALVRSVSLDGKPNGVAVYTERGHPSFRSIVEMKPGQTVTIVLHLTEPASTDPMQAIKQPGVRQIAVTTRDHSCVN